MRRLLQRLARPLAFSFVCASHQISLETPEQRRYSESLHNQLHSQNDDNKQQFHQHAIVISGNSNRDLAKGITDYLKTYLSDVHAYKFSDGELIVKVNENVRGKDVYIIQSTNPPVHEHLMELILMVTALRRASARKINLVVPYYGYSRQNRMYSAADIARLLEIVGVDRLIALDLHIAQIQGYFGPRVPVDNLEANLVAVNYLKHQPHYTFKKLVVVSPDAGGVARAKNFKEQLQQLIPEIEVDFAIVIRQHGQYSDLIGNVKDSDVIIVDDMIDTGATLCSAVKAVKQMGANKVLAFATHALLTGGALNRLKDCPIDQIIISNTIQQSEAEKVLGSKLQILSVAPLMAEAIYRIQMKDSLTNLFRQLPTISKD